jgi:transposase
MLQPVVRRTWAPQGETPIQYSWDRRDRRSVISAITVSARRRRLGLYFKIHDHNIATDDFERFIEKLLRYLQRRIILVMDRWSVHRSGGRRVRERFARRVAIEWLPSYAPDLNPAEQVWTHTKYADLANFIPDDVHQLDRALRRSLRRSAGKQELLSSFFKHAGLNL